MYGVFAVDLEMSKGRIIQIGFYKVSAKGKVTELCIHVKPYKGFKIDNFVASLTRITQDDIDRGVSFKEALNIIRKAGVSECIGVAWGSDFKTIAGHCQTYGLDNPFLKADTLVDVQRVVQALLGLRDQPALRTMLEKAPKDVQKSNSVYQPEILATKYFEIGKDAVELENKFKELQATLCFGRPSKKLFPDGYTETLPIESLQEALELFL